MNKKMTILLGAVLISSALNANVLAKVDGTAITEKEVNAILSRIPNAQKYNKLPKNMQKTIVQKTIEKKLLESYVEKQGIEDTNKFKEKLNALKKDLAIQVWMENQNDKIEISDSEAKKFYNDNKTKFKVPAQVQAKHILVKTKKEAMILISKLNKVSSSKLDKTFTNLAKKNSIGPSAVKGGELGWFGKGSMVPEFSKAAFDLKKGTFTKKPVKTQYGYHIIYLEDKKAQSYVDFAKVKANILKNMKLQKLSKQLKDKTKELRDSHKIEIMDK